MIGQQVSEEAILEKIIELLQQLKGSEEQEDQDDKGSPIEGDKAPPDLGALAPGDDEKKGFV